MKKSDFEQLKADLSFAIERDELQLLYQPQIETSTGRLVAVETTTRWKHPRHGFLLSSLFIPIAEECGLIYSIGEWVLRNACRQSTIWETIHYIDQPKITVNLSAQQLIHSDIVETIMHILEFTKIKPEKLELELTETAIMNNPENANIILNRIKDLGIQIAIDDFGTGCSSLKYLAELPINTLKIDHTFINLCSMHDKQNAIVISTIALAHSLGLNVVADGVETKEQVDFLRNYECDFLQGNYFSEPLSNDHLIIYIKQNH